MADKTPKELEEVPVTIDVDGKTTTFTLEATYTPETNDAGKVIKASDGSFALKNSDGNVVLNYDGATNTFTNTSDTSNDLTRQVSNYQTGKPGSKGIDYIVKVAALQISNDSGIDTGSENNTAFIKNKNDAFASEVELTKAAQVVSQAAIATRYTRDNYGDYFYPEDIRSNKQDRIRFTMRRSEGSDIDFNLGARQRFKRKRGQPISGSVTLPMQPGITDANAVDWNPGQLNAVQAFGAGASLRLMNSGNIEEMFTRGGQILKNVASELTDPNKGREYNAALKVYLAQQAVGVQGLLSRTQGAVLNPNMELLFNAPALRPFTFNFILSPRDESEAKQVKQIIRFFKQGMSVKTSNTIFLKAPHIFDVRYQTFDKSGNEIQDHPSLNRIKTCALTGFNVDYTPSGSYMTFNDEERTMTQYAVQMNFTELNPIYEDDYNSSGETLEPDGSGKPREGLKDNEIGF